MEKIFETRNGVKYCHIKSQSPISYFGIVTLNGANYESDDEFGISHFCEHMFFKGTKTRDYAQLNNELGLLGAKPNAYTSRQGVVYYATCPSFNFQAMSSILCDMFFNSEFAEEEFEKEKKVILEERKMYNDSKEASFSEHYLELIFGDRVGHSILGKESDIESITRDKLLEYIKKTINKDDTVFVYSGPDSIESMIEIVESYVTEDFLSSKSDNYFVIEDLINYENNFDIEKEDGSDYDIVYYRDQMEQAHLSLMFPTIVKIKDGLVSKDIYVQQILLDALGGGMYSVLFDEIREKKGLCYGIYSGAYSPNYYSKGLGYIDSQTSYDRLPELLSSIEKCIDDVINNGIPETAFKCAKANAVSSLAHSSEKSSSKVGDLSELAMIYDNQVSVDEKIKLLSNVSIEEVNDLLKKLFSGKRITAVMLDSKYKV